VRLYKVVWLLILIIIVIMGWQYQVNWLQLEENRQNSASPTVVRIRGVTIIVTPSSGMVFGMGATRVTPVTSTEAEMMVPSSGQQKENQTRDGNFKVGPINAITDTITLNTPTLQIHR
jgi:hypothetical protein